MDPKFGMQTAKIALTTAQTVFCAKFDQQNSLFRVCVRMLGKNLMLQLHTIFLYNHAVTVYTCMASKCRKSTPKFACTMCMRTEFPKRMRAGQSENKKYS